MERDDPSAKQEKRPAVEWIFGLMSGLGVVVLLAYLGYQAQFSSSRPPDLTVSLAGVEQGFATIEVTNRGDRAASAVTVLAGTGSGPQRMVEFDYVAPHSVRRGEFALPAGLNAEDLRLEIGGFVEP